MIGFNLPQMNFATMGSVRQSVKLSLMQQNMTQPDMTQLDMMQQDEATSATIHSKNPYEKPHRDITTKDWKKIVPVSDEIRQKILAHVKDSYTNYAGMQTSENCLVGTKVAYIDSVPPEQQSYVSWTLDQIQIEEARRVSSFIRERDPTWEHGEQVKREILDEFYSKPTLDVTA